MVVKCGLCYLSWYARCSETMKGCCSILDNASSSPNIIEWPLLCFIRSTYVFVCISMEGDSCTDLSCKVSYLVDFFHCIPLASLLKCSRPYFSKSSDTN